MDEERLASPALLAFLILVSVLLICLGACSFFWTPSLALRMRLSGAEEQITREIVASHLARREAAMQARRPEKLL